MDMTMLMRTLNNQGKVIHKLFGEMQDMEVHVKNVVVTMKRELHVLTHGGNGNIPAN